MSDLFGRQDSSFGGGLSADELTMTFPDAPDGALLVQQVGINYSQPIRRIYDLSNGKFIYYVIGRAEGSWQMSCIYGLAGLMIAFYEAYGNACQSNNVSLSATAGCSTQEKATWSMDGFIISMVGMQATAQELLIQEQNQGMFTELSLS